MPLKQQAKAPGGRSDEGPDPSSSLCGSLRPRSELLQPAEGRPRPACMQLLLRPEPRLRRSQTPRCPGLGDPPDGAPARGRALSIRPRRAPPLGRPLLPKRRTLVCSAGAQTSATRPRSWLPGCSLARDQPLLGSHHPQALSSPQDKDRQLGPRRGRQRWPSTRTRRGDAQLERHTDSRPAALHGPESCREAGQPARCPQALPAGCPTEP